MTISPDRIEAAARAMAADDANDWDEIHAAAQASYMRIARAGLTAAFPELASGSHWLAPCSDTETLIETLNPDHLIDAYLNATTPEGT